MHIFIDNNIPTKRETDFSLKKFESRKREREKKTERTEKFVKFFCEYLHTYPSLVVFNKPSQ